MSFSQVTIESWPSHDCRPIAVLRREPADLRKQLGITFREDRDDLDDLEYASLRLPTGDQILLVRHRHAPNPGTEVYGDAESDHVQLLQTFLAETGLSPSEVAWPDSTTHAWDLLAHELVTTLKRANEGDVSARAPMAEGVLGDIAQELNQFLVRFEHLSGWMGRVAKAAADLQAFSQVLERNAKHATRREAEALRVAGEALSVLEAAVQSAGGRAVGTEKESADRSQDPPPPTAVHGMGKPSQRPR